jgi:hypothetical protein
MDGKGRLDNSCGKKKAPCRLELPVQYHEALPVLQNLYLSASFKLLQEKAPPQ